MKHPLIRQGEGPAAAHERLQQEREDLRHKLDRIARDSTAITDIVTHATAAGDERKLRGIPAIGRSVTGAIPGTIPHAVR